MKTIEITQKNAIAAFKKADKSGKQLLSDLLGEENVMPQNIMERIKSYEDACEDQNIDPVKNLIHVAPQNDEEEADNLMRMIRTIAKSLKEGVVYDYSNENQKKWYVWYKFDASSGAFRFDVSGCVYANAVAGCGARLSMPSKELAEYFGKLVEPLMSKYLLIQ